VASAAAMLACLVIVAASFVRRRPRSTAWVVADGGELADPRTALGETPPAARAVVAAAVVGTGSGLVAGPLVGLALGTLVLVVALRPRRRLILSMGAVASLAVTGLYTTAKQAVLGYPSVFEWPTFFSEMHVAGWFAILFIAADVVVELVRRGRPAPGRIAVTPKSFLLTEDLHRYLVAHGTPPDPLAAELIEVTSALGPVSGMQIAPEQGPSDPPHQAVGSPPGRRGGDLHRLLRSVHRPWPAARRPPPVAAT